MNGRPVCVRCGLCCRERPCSFHVSAVQAMLDRGERPDSFVPPELDHVTGEPVPMIRPRWEVDSGVCAHLRIAHDVAGFFHACALIVRHAPLRLANGQTDSLMVGLGCAWPQCRADAAQWARYHPGVPMTEQISSAELLATHQTMLQAAEAACHQWKINFPPRVQELYQRVQQERAAAADAQGA